MLTALTRKIGPNISHCELTFVSREPISAEKAIAQHHLYQQKLTELGVQVISLPLLPDHPDGVFVEDTAIVLPEIAVITNMGAESRRAEVKTIEDELRSYRPLKHLNPPATLDGGDVLKIGNTFYIGLSKRTNHHAVFQIQELFQSFGYKVRAVEVNGCLHLKTGCTYLGKNMILINPLWVDANQFSSYEIISVTDEEPFGANSLLIGDTLLYSASFPRTRERLAQKGVLIEAIDISELEKAEAGLTCMSIVFDV